MVLLRWTGWVCWIGICVFLLVEHVSMYLPRCLWIFCKQMFFSNNVSTFILMCAFLLVHYLGHWPLVWSVNISHSGFLFPSCIVSLEDDELQPGRFPFPCSCTVGVTSEKPSLVRGSEDSCLRVLLRMLLSLFRLCLDLFSVHVCLHKICPIFFNFAFYA